MLFKEFSVKIKSIYKNATSPGRPFLNFENQPLHTSASYHNIYLIIKNEINKYHVLQLHVHT